MTASNTNLDLLIREIRMAGVSPIERERMEHIEKRRITADMVIPEQEYLFHLHDKPCFPLGELVGVTGKAKSGKTFFSSILITLAMRGRLMGMSRIRDTIPRVMWIDTEQSRQSTQRILRYRIMRLIEHTAPRDDTAEIESHIDVFNLRADNWNERLALVETAVRRHRPELVIFDGIRDCTNDINDQVLSENIISRLTQLASGTQLQDGEAVPYTQWPPCCIVCVLHENKAADDNTLRGALGTELGNKAFEVYEVTKDMKTLVFKAQQRETREYTIQEPLEFVVDDHGFPQLINPQGIEAEEEKPLPEIEPSEHTILCNIFRSIIPDGGEVRANVMRSMMDELYGFKSNRRREELIETAIERKLIAKRQQHGKLVFYRLGPNMPPPTLPSAPQMKEGELPF